MAGIDHDAHVSSIKRVINNLFSHTTHNIFSLSLRKGARIELLHEQTKKVLCLGTVYEVWILDVVDVIIYILKLHRKVQKFHESKFSELF